MRRFLWRRSRRKEITLDPKITDRYVGVYKLDSYMLITTTREDDKFYAQLTGQPKCQRFPESEKQFFLKVVDAQLSFDVAAGDGGAVTQAVLHQNGQNSPARRLNAEEAKAAQEGIKTHDVEVAQRFKEQKQSPGTEAALRRTILELQSGKPKYELMTSQFAELTRKQLPQPCSRSWAR